MFSPIQTPLQLCVGWCHCQQMGKGRYSQPLENKSVDFNAPASTVPYDARRLKDVRVGGRPHEFARSGRPLSLIPRLSKPFGHETGWSAVIIYAKGRAHKYNDCLKTRLPPIFCNAYPVEAHGRGRLHPYSSFFFFFRALRSFENLLINC